MNRPTFGWPVLAALFIGLAGGLFMSRYSGPLASPPDVRALIDRLHKSTVRNAKSDTALAFYRLQLVSRDSGIMRLKAVEVQEKRSSDRTLARNRAQLDSLRAHPESVLVYAARLDSGIVAQGEQCTNAISACDAAKDSLRSQIGERDSIIADRTAQRDTSQAIAGTAVAADKKLHAQLLVTRILAVAGIVGALFVR